MSTVAKEVAGHLLAHGVQRIYGLCGGHIQPLWDEVARAGIRVIDVRHEASAVHMATADAELTGGLGVALVTAGPGLTNAVTGIANAAVARSPVLVISGRTPRPQTGMSSMQDIPQAAVVAPLCRRVEVVSERHRVLPQLDAAISAAIGNDGPAGPAYFDLPADLWDEELTKADITPGPAGPRRRRPMVPDDEQITAASRLVRKSRRVVVIGGKAALGAPEEMVAFLDHCGALYLDTGESRGAVPPDHPAAVPAMRGQAMSQADLVITIGRRLDFQLGYGSPAVFDPSAAFIRIGRSYDEVAGNRRADAEIWGDADMALAALVGAGSQPSDPDHSWVQELRQANQAKSGKLRQSLTTAEPDPDGLMHPYRLLAEVANHLTADSVVVADGGDILSFARVALPPVRTLDCGSLGCLGVGVPFATAAALVEKSGRPDPPVIAVIGDGSFGFSAMDVDTAVRQQANVLFVIANNGAWNIERHDQLQRYDGNLVGVDLPGCRYDLVAEGLGAYAERVDDADGLPGAFGRALDNLPALLDVAVSRQPESPDFRSGLAAVPARQALRTWDEAERERHG
ncbi:thiamine pyrophosphate-binding protein [soil metagenome]